MTRKIGRVTDEILIFGRGRFILFAFDSFEDKVKIGDSVELRQAETVVWQDEVIAVEFATLSGGIAHPALLLKHIKNFPVHLETRNLELWKVELGDDSQLDNAALDELQ
jgi:hypothetical protein